MKKIIFRLLSIALVVGFIACSPKSEQSVTEELRIDFEKYTLENGLDVVLHHDKSDPIVSVAIMYHVGSNREKPGHTGFAHLFEHMLFQESENVPQDQFFKKIQDAGGTLNGGTWHDGTVYYEVVPKNALEMVLWLESDRMGFLINTVTEAAFINQQEVVQNEKRQRVDNRPYGHTNYVISKNIFPEGHPYNWQVIGELVDLQNATVEDVKEFYRNFYGPNNATLVIAGNFDTEHSKQLVEKYFGEIKRGADVSGLEIQNVTLSESKRLFHEDNFATAPQMNMVWPTVEQYNKDAYALDFLAEIISEGKKAQLYKVLVKEKNLTSDTYAWNDAREIAGMFRIRITANQGIPLDSIEQGIHEAFTLLEETGISERDVERIKASLETGFYNSISSILGKSFQLAQYNVFAGDPEFIEKNIANIKAVTKENVMAVYEKYIKDKPYVITSFVPKGQPELAASDSERAHVVEEEIVENVDRKIADTGEIKIEKTPSRIDRSVEPEKGPDPTLNIPEQWTATLDNGLNIYGIRHTELPLVQFSLIIEGGHLLDDFNKIGVANLMTDIMMEGTKNKTPEELEEEIDLLGANINMFTGSQSITITANSLSRNFEKTLILVEEILLEPRWDEEEFALIKTKTINQIKRNTGNPSSVARKVYYKLLYGEEHMLGYDTYGTEEQVDEITIDDLKSFYNNNYSPTVARFHIAGNVSSERVLSALESLSANWKPKEVAIPEYALPDPPDKARLYFVDFPDAKQSVINIGYLALDRNDEDYFPATVMNYKLGGSFSGNVNLILREEKGYTYGARTYFSGTKIPGPFTASSSVRTNATFESVKIFKEEMEKYREGISEDDLEFTKNALIKSNARKFETLRSLIGMLQTRSAYNFPEDYIKKEEDIIRNMTLEEHKALAQKYITPDKMIYFVTGDAATQFEQFKDTGFEDVILLDKNGRKVDVPIEIDVSK
ncbi:MAG: insulinase family protein [Bacteroidetes bacterium]|nr:insulinase family protein [Bacteroidota bacterium]